jgi:hypothetical protein
MVDDKLERQGVFDVLYTPCQSLEKLSTNPKSPKENTKHVNLSGQICATSLQQRLKLVCILEIHDTIMHELVFDRWHF